MPNYGVGSVSDELVLRAYCDFKCKKWTKGFKTPMKRKGEQEHDKKTRIALAGDRAPEHGQMDTSLSQRGQES